MGPGHENRVVLVIDDEPAIRLLCRVNLELGGYHVLEAASIEQARGQLDAGVDAVLLDLHLGRDHGYELLDELRERGIPVAIVTGSTDLEIAAGHRADAVLGKPFTIVDLESTVATLTSSVGR